MSRDNRALWAMVLSVSREFQATDYPVILGLNRILRRVEAANVTKNPVRVTDKRTQASTETSARGARETVNRYREPVTRKSLLGRSKITGARARTLVEEQPRLSPAQLDAIRARARGRRAKP